MAHDDWWQSSFIGASPEPHVLWLAGSYFHYHVHCQSSPILVCSSSGLFAVHWRIYQIHLLSLCQNVLFSSLKILSYSHLHIKCFRVCQVKLCSLTSSPSTLPYMTFLILLETVICGLCLYGLSGPSRSYDLCWGTVFFSTYHIWHLLWLFVSVLSPLRRDTLSYNLFLSFQSLERDSRHTLSTQWRRLYWVKCVIVTVWLWMQCCRRNCSKVWCALQPQALED